MAKVVILSNTDGYYALAKKSLNSLRKDNILKDEGAAYLVTEGCLWDCYWEQLLEGSEVVIIEWMGVTLETPYLQGALDYLKKRDIAFKIHAGGEAEGNASNIFKADDHVLTAKYSVYGGIENFKNLWLWLLQRFCALELEYNQPQQMLWNGIYHPNADKVYTSLEEYQEKFCNPNYPTIGLIFYRNEWLLDNLAYQKALVEECFKQKVNIIAVFSHGVKNPEMGAPGLEEAVNKYFIKDGKTIIDALINTIKFSLTASASLDLSVLKNLNVPLLQAYTLMRSTEEWRENIQGMSAVEVAISITMPEFDGALHSVPVAGKYRDEDNIIYYVPMAERIERLVSKASKWAALRHKANKDKKLQSSFIIIHQQIQI